MKPISFSDPMIRAILDGKKTQTRRPIKNKIFSNGFCYSKDIGDIVCHNDYLPPSEMMMEVRFGRDRQYVGEGWEHLSPFGQMGDRLWVREAWGAWRQTSIEYDEWEPVNAIDGSWEKSIEQNGLPFIEYRATSSSVGPWKRSTHMPKWASRIELEITDVRAEKLHDITEQDAESEGVTLDSICGKLNGEPATLYPMSHIQAFLWLWNSQHKQKWDTNPWVWKIEFKRIQ